MKEFLKKINNGYDGLIRSIGVKSFSSASIVVSVMDEENDYEWINVRFEIDSIVEFKVIQRINTSNIVLSEGIKVEYYNSHVYIAFSPYSNELRTLEDFRNSDVYFGCKNIKFTIEPYSE